MTFKRFNISKPEKRVRGACHRCGGSGLYRGHTYNGQIYTGECFGCGGNGMAQRATIYGYPKDWSDEQIIEWNEKREQRNAKSRQRAAEKREAKAKEKYEATISANRAALPELSEASEWVRANPDRYVHRIITDMIKKSAWFVLSEKQCDLFRKIWSEHDKSTEVKGSHIGTIGKRDVFDLTKTGETYFQGEFGITFVIFCTDADGNRVIIKGSGADAEALYDSDKGNEFKVKGTVKDHTERQGEKQTVLNRVKWIDQPQNQEAA